MSSRFIDRNLDPKAITEDSLYGTLFDKRRNEKRMVYVMEMGLNPLSVKSYSVIWNNLEALQSQSMCFHSWPETPNYYYS